MKIIENPEKLRCEDVIKCVFNLNNLDLKVYKKLKQKNNLRADQLSKLLKKERSTIYRSLQKLTSCGICKKKTNNLEKGGYCHTYHCKDTKKISKEAEKCLDKWYKTMKKKLNEI